jgi:hypothetical protein
MSENTEIKDKDEGLEDEEEVIDPPVDNLPNLFVEASKELVIKPVERNGQKAESSAKKVPTGKKPRGKGKPFVKGEDPRRNTDGRPEGRKNFGTIWKMFIEKVALDNDMTPEGVEAHLVSVGFIQAQKGNVAFWNSILDRVYGRATFPIDHTGEVEVKGAKELAEAVQAILEEDDETAPAKPVKQSKEKPVEEAKAPEPVAPKPEAVQDVLSDENNSTTKESS